VYHEINCSELSFDANLLDECGIELYRLPCRRRSPATGRGGYTAERSDYASISGISSPISIALLAGVSSRASSI
jgi:hypothetical protein